VSQAEPAHTRGAIISDLACIVAEISDIQVEHAKLTERTAVLQSRVGRMIRDLSCTTAPVRPGADLQGMRERLGEVRGRLEATAETIKNSAGRTASAAQAAPPPTLAPSAQDAATPVRAGKALDEAPAEGAGKGSAAGQSRECVTSAGALPAIGTGDDRPSLAHARLDPPAAVGILSRVVSIETRARTTQRSRK
jgi:hypothetical protein